MKRSATGLLVLAFALAACQGGSAPSAGPTPAPSNATPSSSEQDRLPEGSQPLRETMPEPKAPATAAFTQESAAAFAKYAIDAVIWGYATNDPSKLEAIAAPDAPYINTTAIQMRQYGTQGLTRHGGHGKLTGEPEVTLKQDGKQATMKAPYQLDAGWVVDGGGKIVFELPQIKRTVTITALFLSGQWKLANLQFAE